MSRHIALLRGINVGGHRVKMDRLRELFGEMGFTDVATFIASGNVIFDAASDDGGALEAQVEQALASALGFEVPTFIRSAEGLADVAERAAAAATAAGLDGEGACTYVLFAKEALSDEVAASLRELESAYDRFVVNGREVFWLLAGKMSESPLFKGNAVARALGDTEHTARNLTSVRKLLAKHGPTG